MVGKLTDEVNKLKEENERLIQANKKWTKNAEEWKKNREKNKRFIEELETKLAVLKETNHDRKYIIEELNTKIDANKLEIAVLQKSKDEIENQTIETAATEIEGLKKKYQNALNEMFKLAKLVRVYGKYKLLFILLSLKYINYIFI